MADSVELEIGLHRRDGETWTVELQCTRPLEDVDVRLVQDGPRFDLRELRGLAHDDREYGFAVTNSLFAVPEVKQFFAMARLAAESHDLALRLRLYVGPSAMELNEIRWESLRNPETGTRLLTDERIMFSRYLSSMDWRRVGIRPKTDLRVLAVIASPSDLADYRPGGRELPAVDVARDEKMIRGSLRPVEPVVRASRGTATLDQLIHDLHEGCDILYLVCHGYLVHGEPQLLLESSDGRVHRVQGSDLVDCIRDLRAPPRLVILVSCDSAGEGEGVPAPEMPALTALGPRLAEAGVPAVIAMQGGITLETAHRMMPVFFRELRRDGQIDRALAVARGAVRDRHDWWVPVLFTRLKSVRLYYVAGFTGTFDKWPALFADIRNGRCTPILGPGLADGLVGSREEIAARWASVYHFPLSPYEREDLSQVSQYLATTQNYRFPRESLKEYLRAELLDRYELPPGMRDAPLDELIRAADELRRTRGDPDVDPYSILAGLPFPIYVTTDPSDLLSTALRSHGKNPRIGLCRWSGEADHPDLSLDLEGYRPDEANPLVYHLFGSLRYPDSVALTADDYQDFLIAVSTHRELIPPVVRRALSDSALLFLGFRIDQGDFRVVFRSLMQQEGRGRRKRYSHVAVQIDPEESTILEPDRARRYLQEYFGGVDVSLCWNTALAFAGELAEGWERYSR